MVVRRLQTRGVMDGRRILVVDDDLEAREMLREFFNDRDYIVETAAGGPEALQQLMKFDADLLVTDLQMPGMSGLELIRELHATRPDCPAVLMTASVDRELPLRQLGLRAGFDTLCKPLDLDEVAALADRLTGATASVIPVLGGSLFRNST
jgi:two-component system OmpR family response regulator